MSQLLFKNDTGVSGGTYSSVKLQGVMALYREVW